MQGEPQHVWWLIRCTCRRPVWLLSLCAACMLEPSLGTKLTPAWLGGFCPADCQLCGISRDYQLLLWR